MSPLCTTRSLAVLAFIATIEGCASAHPRSVFEKHDARDGLPPPHRDYDRLTAREIATVAGFPTAYEAVQQLRHRFLEPAMTSRGGFDRRLPVVLINNTPRGGVDVRRSKPPP